MDAQASAPAADDAVDQKAGQAANQPDPPPVDITRELAIADAYMAGLHDGAARYGMDLQTAYQLGHVDGSFEGGAVAMSVCVAVVAIGAGVWIAREITAGRMPGVVARLTIAPTWFTR